jgi:3-methyladenine DNA glycosylase AlkD
LSSQSRLPERLKKQKTQALIEVTERTRSRAIGTTAASPENQFRRFSIRVPVVRALVKDRYKFFNQPREDIVSIWTHIWKNTEWYEVAHQALYYYQHKTINKAEFRQIKSWVSRCDCWEHSDDLSKIYAQVVEDNPVWILPTFEIWNRSKSPWKRRQSVVGLIEYASKRKSVLPFPDLIKFVDPLLNDEDYYVQKGVGWTLREIYNLYPLDALGYIQAKVLLLHPLAYSSATEKLDKVSKKQLNLERKQYRTA